MDIQFDEDKRRRTLDQRGLDFVDSARIFEGVSLTLPDDRADYGEARFFTVGFLDERMILVVWTPRGESRRIISMRKCNAREQNRFRGFLDRSR